MTYYKLNCVPNGQFIEAGPIQPNEEIDISIFHPQTANKLSVVNLVEDWSE